VNPALAAELRDWWWPWLRTSARDGWEWLPGPWPVKLLLIVLLTAGQLIPGEADEALLLLAIAGVKRLVAWRRRR
jgi:hypothetical protein